MIIFLREKFIAQIFMWIIAVVFIIGTIMLYGGSGGQQNAGTEGEVVLKIGTLEVTREIFEERISQAVRQQQQNPRFGAEPDRKVIEKRLINGYIQRVIEGSASITDAEVMHYIRSDENRVRTYNQFGPDVLEFYRYQLSESSLRDGIQNLELVTDTEAEQDYHIRENKAKVKFIEFRHSDYEKTLEVEDAEIEKYFQENKEDYATEEQVNIRYININPADFVTQTDIEQYYTDNQNLFMNPELVKARHILKKFPDRNNVTDEDRTSTKAAAEELLKTVKEEIASGTSFADLAEKHSEDTGSAVDGGALGTSYDHLPEGKYFGRGQMVKPFEEACFDVLQSGEVSDLVESVFGYHIIQLEEKHPPSVKSFPEVESEIRDKLVQIDGVDGAENVARELLYEIEFEDYETAIELDKYKELSLESGETGFFSKGERTIPQIGSSGFYGGLVEEVFDMEVGVTKTIETKGFSNDVSAIFVVTVLGKKAPGIPELEDVKAQVIGDIERKRSKERAFADAQQLLDQRAEGETLEELNKKYKIPEGTKITQKPVQESNLFNLAAGSTYVPGMGDVKDAMFAAFDMSVGDVKGPFAGSSSTYIIELVERVEPDYEIYQTDPTQKVERYKTLLQSKKTDAYVNWLGARKKALAANVWIHEDYR